MTTKIDIHTYNASQLFKVPYVSVTKEQRKIAKAWVHGVAYSSGEIKLGLLVGQYPIIYEG